MRSSFPALRSLPRARQSRDKPDAPAQFADRSRSRGADDNAYTREIRLALLLQVRERSSPARVSDGAPDTKAGSKFPWSARRKRNCHRAKRLAPELHSKVRDLS